MSDVQINGMSSQALAFVGDAVYSLLIREYLAKTHPDKKNLHKMSVEAVNCKAQSAAAEILLPLLNENEEAVYKRGRNTNTVSSPKNADVADYRRATGVEALFGWLYLRGDNERIELLFDNIKRSL